MDTGKSCQDCRIGDSRLQRLLGKRSGQRCGSVTPGREGMKDSKESHVRPAVKCPPSCPSPARPAAPGAAQRPRRHVMEGRRNLAAVTRRRRRAGEGRCTRPLPRPLQTAGFPPAGAGPGLAWPRRASVTSAEMYRRTTGGRGYCRHSLQSSASAAAPESTVLWFHMSFVLFLRILRKQWSRKFQIFLQCRNSRFHSV